MSEPASIQYGNRLSAWSSLVLAGFLLLVSIWGAVLNPVLAFALPVVGLTLIGLLLVIQRPLLHLASVLFLFLFVAKFEEGFQIAEALYGLYFLGYLATWLAVTPERFDTTGFRTYSGWALIGFFACVVCSTIMTVVFDGSMRGAMSEGLALLFLALFFPTAHAAQKYENGIKIVLGVLLAVGTAVVLRNLYTYAQGFASAVYVYEIARGRVITNEVLILAATVISLAWFAVSNARFLGKCAIWSLFSILFAGLLLTQSRTYWLAFGLAGALLFVFLPGRYRGRLVTGSFATLLSLGLAAYIVVPDYVTLIVAGLIERVTSIGSAASTDISLINRFNEAGAVWDKIKLNPIVGYGMGTPYRFYDITFELSRSKTFVHNAYLGLWYKFGIVGLLLALSFVLHAIRSGLRSASRTTSTQVFVGAVSASAVLASLLLTSLTTNPFYLSDTTFTIGILSGLAIGCFHKTLTVEQAS